MDRLSAYNSDGEEARHVAISLFIGPKAASNKKWQSVLMELAKNGLIQLVIIDEAHFVSQSGRHFRPEFYSAVKFLGNMVKAMPTRVPRVLLSATMLK